MMIQPLLEVGIHLDAYVSHQNILGLQQLHSEGQKEHQEPEGNVMHIRDGSQLETLYVMVSSATIMAVHTVLEIHFQNMKQILHRRLSESQMYTYQ